MTDRSSRPALAARELLVPGATLVVATVLGVVAPLLTLVRAADGSSTAPPVATGWLAAVPLLAVVLAAIGRSARRSGAAIVGVGAVAIGRAMADLGLLFSPDSVLRPELFGVSTVAAFPLAPTAWAVVPLLGDLLAVAAAGLAIGLVFEGADLAPVVHDDRGVEPGSRRRLARVDAATLVGLLGVALVVAASLGVLYDSPIPVVRPLGLGDIGLYGTAGAALGAVVLGVLVVVATALPLQSGRWVVLGAAAASAVPPLIVLLAGPAARPSGLVWIGLSGAVLLGGSALLRRDSGTAPNTADVDDRTTTGRSWESLVPAVLALAAAGCALLGYARPQAVSALGASTTSIDAAGAAYLPAAVLVGVAGILTAVAPTARAGRLALTVVWAGAFAALLTASDFTSSSIWVSNAVIADGAVQRSNGSSWGLAATALAVLAAVSAAVVSARRAEADRAGEYGVLTGRRQAVALSLTLLAVLAYAMPVFSANGRTSATLFQLGSRVDGYGSWAALLTVVAAVWIAARPGDRVRTTALLVASAGLVATRVLLTPAVQHQLGFGIEVGFWVSMVLAVLLLIAAPELARQPSVVSPAPLPRTHPVPTGRIAEVRQSTPSRSTAASKSALGRPKGKRARR